jgi:L-ascorbate metabolism protein UlaG (beta-lactamase superfamily)
LNYLEVFAMSNHMLDLTYLNGPTALLEIGGLRFLTDPTFDPSDTTYPLAGYSLHKTGVTPIDISALGEIDAVLLSHDHHVDNLDKAGRALLSRVKRTFTTQEGATRLGGQAEGLEPWESVELLSKSSQALRITATPARHGPEGGDRGPVIGFVLELTDSKSQAVYVSGDTVWFDGVAEVNRRFSIGIAILFMGAAKVSVAGPGHLTFTAGEAVEATRAFSAAKIVPMHFEGWKHLTESRTEIISTFAAAGLSDRLIWPAVGQQMRLALG